MSCYGIIAMTVVHVAMMVIIMKCFIVIPEAVRDLKEQQLKYAKLSQKYPRTKKEREASVSYRNTMIALS